MAQADATTRIIRYEIGTRRDGRWMIECARERESEAIALARTLLASKSYEAVRVMRERDLHGTTLVQTPIFEATCSGDGSQPLRVSASDERDCWCTELDELYGARSRRAIGQLLRSFLDQLKITPTELLHNIRIRLARSQGGEGFANLTNLVLATATAGLSGRDSSEGVLHVTVVVTDLESGKRVKGESQFSYATF